MMKDRLGANAVPIQIPMGAEDQFVGLIDLVKMQAIVYGDDLGKDEEFEPIPEEYVEEARNGARTSWKPLLKATTTDGKIP